MQRLLIYLESEMPHGLMESRDLLDTVNSRLLLARWQQRGEEPVAVGASTLYRRFHFGRSGSGFLEKVMKAAFSVALGLNEGLLLLEIAGN